MSAPKLFALTCPKCGAGLKVGESVETFACSYCGASVKVEHGGGIVSLRLLGEEVQKIRQGTDRTAAELAITRLTEELAVATAREDELRKAVVDAEMIRQEAVRELEKPLIGIVGWIVLVIEIGVACLLFYSGWTILVWLARALIVIAVIQAIIIPVEANKLREASRHKRERAEGLIHRGKPLLDAACDTVFRIKDELYDQRAILKG